MLHDRETLPFVFFSYLYLQLAVVASGGRRHNSKCDLQPLKLPVVVEIGYCTIRYTWYKKTEYDQEDDISHTMWQKIKFQWYIKDKNSNDMWPPSKSLGKLH